MEKIENQVLLALLKNDDGCVYATESHTIEFKAHFAWSDKTIRAKYSKSMAAFCNNEGGYIFFGIEDATGKILGVNNFDAVDSADISSHLNNYFSPAVNFHKTSIEIAGKKIGVIYIEKYKDIPTICTKEFGDILKDGALYFRYSAKSDVITGKDLMSLLHKLKGENSKELIDLKKAELKLAALPILQTTGGGSSQTSFNFKIGNIGKRARIDDIKITKGNLNLFQHSIPKWIEQNQELRVEGTNLDGVPMAFVAYELEIYYSDSLGTRYLITAIGKGPHIKFGDPSELNNVIS